MANVTATGYVKSDDPIYSTGLIPMRVLKLKNSSKRSTG
jgi:hypothetical protein